MMFGIVTNLSGIKSGGTGARVVRSATLLKSMEERELAVSREDEPYEIHTCLYIIYKYIHKNNNTFRYKNVGD